MHPRRLAIWFGLLAVLAVPLGSAITPPADDVPTGPTRAFIADDPDPAAGTLPPFVMPGLGDVVRAENVSTANISRMRDFYYATTQPRYRVGADDQTLREYRLAQLQSIERNDSTSLWLPDSQRSNGTVVRDAHITLLGASPGTKTRLGATNQSQAGNEPDRLLLPRSGSALVHLDYATRLPNGTCTVTGETKRCQQYTVLDQRVNRSVSIGDQTWSDDDGTPRQLAYTDATATAPTTLEVRATITTTVETRTRTYVRKNGGWTLANTSQPQTRVLTHTVADQAPAVVTTNQNLSVTQAIVRSEDGDGTDRIVLRFEGPRTVTDRRLWSYARFADSTGRLQNVWGLYSQRQYTTATRSHRVLSGSNAAPPPATMRTERDRSSAQQSSAPTARQQTVSFPNVLELQLTARSRHPSIRWTRNTGVTAAPEISRVNGFNFSSGPAPVDRRVNLTSVQPRGYRTIVITNTDQPISGVRDIHNDSIPMTTRTVQERNASLATTILNETHVRFRLTDASTGQPLGGRTVWLTGAAQGRVVTNSDGVAVVERRDLYVTASFTGATNVSRNAFYDQAQVRAAFEPTPFNLYQLLWSLAGALVSIAAFLIFYIPVAYMRGEKE